MALVIDQSQAGQQVSLQVGQSAEVRLPENPTTGYRWVVAGPLGAACSLIDRSFQAGSGSVGAGGEHVWQLRAVALGVCDLRLQYVRSFAPDASGAQSFEVHFKVNGLK